MSECWAGPENSVGNRHSFSKIGLCPQSRAYSLEGEADEKQVNTNMTEE